VNEKDRSKLWVSINYKMNELGFYNAVNVSETEILFCNKWTPKTNEPSNAKNNQYIRVEIL
jgi:hypothetical protein